MNKLDPKRQARVIAALVEGNSIRATVRMTGVAKNTIVKLLADIGEACYEYQDKALRNLPCQKIRCDEIWSFCYSKEKDVPEDKKGRFGYGDVRTWTAIDADTKLIASWLVSDRSACAATEFIKDLAGRLANRVQLTTDGHKAYIQAVEEAFGYHIDYAMLVKLYGSSPDAEKRYSPAQCIGAQNLTMRMSMRRFTRLTNGFLKKVENHAYAVSLFVMYYNFCRIHQTLRVTPAMAAGVTDHVWDISDIISLLLRRKHGPIFSS